MEEMEDRWSLLRWSLNSDPPNKQTLGKDNSRKRGVVEGKVDDIDRMARGSSDLWRPMY